MSDMSDSLDMDKLREVFRSEAYELLGELEDALLSLEENPQDKDVVNRIFRALHTIKGSGGSCGFTDISRFTHEVETVYDAIRNDKLAITKEIIDLTLAARDQIYALFEEYYNKKPADAARTAELVERFQALLPTIAKAPVKQPAQNSGKAGENRGNEITYRIRFRPSQDIFLTGTNPLMLLDELRTLGTCRIVAQRSQTPPIEDMNPELCYTFWDVILTTDRGIDAIKDVFIFVQDSSEIKIEPIERAALTDETEIKRLGDILVERGDLDVNEIRKITSAQKKFGEILVEKGIVDSDKVEAALTEQQHVRDLRKERQKTEDISSIRVHSHKLDKLVDLVGELVTVQARLTQSAAEGSNPLLVAIAEEVERLTAELRDNTMSIRMMPIGTIFSKFKRLVRDLSQNLGKEVNLVTEGAETELDKTVIERLNDPLVHLIRNCLDHGLEHPDERVAAGKPREGTVKLVSAHSGAHVKIRIEDDGKGLDVEAIRAKAIEKGLISPDAVLTEKELFQLIFAPGFTTAQKVSDVSGRGVGMDVVKQAISSLRGTVDIISEKGKGTAIVLSLPLTLAIIDGFLTRIGADHFVFPLSLVDECVELAAADISQNGRRMLNIRGEIVPYIELRDQFHFNGDRPAIEQVVICRVEGVKVGFVVDHVLGGHQTVIKNLGRVYKDVHGISGATILGDGSVALILDVPQLFRTEELEESNLV